MFDIKQSCVKHFGSLRLASCDVVDHAPLHRIYLRHPSGVVMILLG